MRWPYTDTLPLVLRSMHVGDDFTKSIEAVLRKQIFDADGFRLEQTQNSAPPLRRTYAQNSVSKKRTVEATVTWRSWQEALCFPPTTSSQMQRLLYFISVQSITPDRGLYESFNAEDMCDKAAANTFDSIDPLVIIMVFESLRLYQNNIKHLIDFSSKCLQGINQKTRQALPVAGQGAAALHSMLPA